MAYLTYDEYLELSGEDEDDEGALQEEQFSAAEFKARKRIDFWTDCRIQKMAEVPEAVKYCMVALIRIEKTFGVEARSAKPLVASFNTDGYSESYGSATEQEAAANTEVARVIRQWLYGELDDEGTPLLYRGVV